MNRIRIGVIGAGGIVARLHLPDLAKNDAYEVALVSGRKESRLRHLCDTFGIPRWTQRYEDVIADDTLDAVLIGTPHPQHVPWGIRAIQAGKHVLMQKPLCGEMKEADDFVAAVESEGSVCLIIGKVHPSHSKSELVLFPNFHNIRMSASRGCLTPSHISAGLRLHRRNPKAV